MLLGQTRAGLKFEVATRALSALKAYVGEQRSSMFCIAKLARKLIKFQNSKPQTRNGGAACTFPTRVRISCILQASHNNSWGWVSLLVAWNALTRSILLACDFVKASQCIAIVTKEEDVMCFRPPDTTSGPLICPECGKKIVSPNFRPVNCPFCKAPLPPEGAPAVPSAGGAPVAPGAPTVPGAPKPPSGK